MSQQPAHHIEVTHPLYGQKGTHTAFCVCGWASEEHPTAGQATIAGWEHIRSANTSTPPTRETSQAEPTCGPATTTRSGA